MAGRSKAPDLLSACAFFVGVTVVLNQPTTTEGSVKPSVHIAGAGLMGSLLAWRLGRQGHRVTLWEASAERTPASAAHTAAAMIAPLAEAVSGHAHIVQHGLRSLDLWPLLLDELFDDGAMRVGYQQKGSILVAHPADEQELDYFERQLKQKLGASEHHNSSDQALQPDLAHVQALNGNREIQALEADLSSQFQRGFFLPQEAHLHQRELLSALIHVRSVFDIHCQYNQPLGCDVRADLEAKGVLGDNDWLFDCRGVGAKHALSTQGEHLRGVRGEVVWIECHAVTIQRPIRLLHPRYQLYLVPKGNGVYMLGATEIESEDRSPLSVRSALELLSALYTLVPAFAEARILELDVNLRPALLDHLPRVHQDGEHLWSINGLYRHGYLLAPAMLEVLQQQLGATLVPTITP